MLESVKEKQSTPSVLSTFLNPGKALLVIDVVGSVQHMEMDEQHTVRTWTDFLKTVIESVLPSLDGRLIKSTGDGLMLEFTQIPAALRASWELSDLLSSIQRQTVAANRMVLRAGIHFANHFVTEWDVFGRDVNLVSRIVAVARPGATVLTAEAKDRLTEDLDAKLTDIGEIYLKNVDRTVRLYEAEHPTVHASVPKAPPRDLRPSVAVLPFASRNTAPPSFAIGGVIADGVVAQLTRSNDFRLIAGQYCLHTPLIPGVGVQQVAASLGANYLLSGSFLDLGQRLIIAVELIRGQTGEVIGSDRFEASHADLTALPSLACHQIAEMVNQKIADRAVMTALSAPMPTLEAHTLLLAGAHMMHRSSETSFALSKQALDELSNRFPQSALCHAWLAKWHVLATTRSAAEAEIGLRSAEQALSHTRMALRAEPGNALAMAVEGFVHLHLRKDMPAANERLNESLALNPNDALALIFKGVTAGFMGHGIDAMRHADLALSVTQCHPLRYYFESLAASCAVCAGEHQRAISWCESSLRRHAMHASTFRTLITAQVNAGRVQEARESARRLLSLKPDFSVSQYRRNLVSAGSFVGEQVMEAMRQAGIPE